MRFEIEADIPDGYEPTGEYRLPLAGEFYLTSNGERKAPMDLSAPWLILRENPLAYEDFAEHYTDALGAFVDRNDGDITICIADAEAYLRQEAAKSLSDWLTAAADHVDLVNAQKEGAS